MAAVGPGMRGRRNMPDLNLEEEEEDWVLRPGESEADYSSRLMSTAERPSRASKKKQPTSTAQDEESGSGKSAMDQEVINRVDQEVKRVEESQERFFSPWKCCWRDCHEYHQKASEAYVRAHVKQHYVSREEQRSLAAREAERLAAMKAKKTSTDAQAVRAKGAHAGKPEESVTEAGKPKESVTEAGKPEESVTEAGKPETPVTDAGKHEESVAADSGKSAVDQEVINRVDEEIFQKVLKYKLRPGFTEKEAASKLRLLMMEISTLNLMLHLEKYSLEELEDIKRICLFQDIKADMLEFEEEFVKRMRAQKAEEEAREARLMAKVAMKPEEEAGKPEESVAVGSGKLAMDQEMAEMKPWNEAEKEEKRYQMRMYNWKTKGPEESEAQYKERLRVISKKPPEESEAHYLELLKVIVLQDPMAKGILLDIWWEESEVGLKEAKHLAKHNKIEETAKTLDMAIAAVRARAKAVKDAEACSGKPEESVADAGKSKESVTEAGTPDKSVTVGSGKLAMYQEMNIPNCTDDEEIVERVLQYKLEGVDDSFIWEGAEEKERRAMVKVIQERMAETRKALFHWQHKLPTKDEESQKAQAPVTRSEKPEESVIHQKVILDDKETLEQVLQEKMDILDLEEVSNRTTKPAADPSSMTIQDDHVDQGKSALAKKMAEEEAQVFAEYRSSWECNRCKECDHFEHITVLSSMQYTHYTPGMVPFSIAETLQIFSIQLKLTNDNAGGFELPLSVYGVLAVRDTVDSRRNILFSCDRTMAQEVTQDDPFLHLTGPSRAIVSEDRVYFEMMLNVKGATASEDKLLIACARIYNQCISTLCFENLFCTLEVCLQTVKDTVQATIVGVQMVHKEELSPLTFKCGGQVACTPLPRPSARADSRGHQKIVLIESKGREVLQGDSGYVHLWRQVVSVERGGGLDVIIQAYRKSGVVAAEGRVHFTAQSCKISQQQCIVGQAQVTVTVAWSIVPMDMDDVLFNDL